MLMFMLVIASVVGNISLRLFDIENFLKADGTVVVKKLSTNPNDYKFRTDPLVARDYILMEDFDETGSVQSLIEFLEFRELEKIVDLKYLRVPVLIDLMNKVSYDVYVAEHGECPDGEHSHGESEEFTDEYFDTPNDKIN